MKRLTARDDCSGRAYYPHCFDKCTGRGTTKKCNVCKFENKICERLADYEDTGLTPKQIRKMKKKMEEREDGREPV